MKYKEHHARFTSAELEVMIDYLSGLSTKEEKDLEQKYEGVDIQELLGHLHNVYEAN